MNMEHILEIVHNKVSSIMEGADERALESQAYKDLMKKIIVSDLMTCGGWACPHSRQKQGSWHVANKAANVTQQFNSVL